MPRRALLALARAIAGCGHPAGPSADAGPADAGTGTGSLSGVWAFPVGSARLFLFGDNHHAAQIRLVDATGVVDCGLLGAVHDALDLRLTSASGSITAGAYGVDESSALHVWVVRSGIVGGTYTDDLATPASGTVTLRAI